MLNCSVHQCRVRIVAILAACLGWGGLIGVSYSALITFQFEGSVIAVSPFLSPPFSTSNTFQGSYTFDSLTPDGTPSTQAGNYLLTNASVTLGGNTYSANMAPTVTPPLITVISNSFGRPTDFALSDDSYRVSFRPSGPAVNELLPSSFSMSISGLRQFPNDSLPLTPPSLSGSDTRISLGFVQPLGKVGGVTGQLTSLTVAPVPVPAAAWLFGSGLAAVTALARRKRKARLESNGC